MKMGYAAVGFGPGELKLGTDLTVLLLDMDEKTNPLVSANVSLDNFGSGTNKLYKIVEVGGMRIGINVGVGQKRNCREKRGGRLRTLEPYQAIPRILANFVPRTVITSFCWRMRNRRDKGPGTAISRVRLGNDC